MANSMSCLRMDEAFSISSSSAKESRSVGDLDFKSFSFIACRPDWMVMGYLNLLFGRIGSRGPGGIRPADRACWSSDLGRAGLADAPSHRSRVGCGPGWGTKRGIAPFGAEEKGCQERMVQKG